MIEIYKNGLLRTLRTGSVRTHKFSGARGMVEIRGTVVLSQFFATFLTYLDVRMAPPGPFWPECLRKLGIICGILSRLMQDFHAFRIRVLNFMGLHTTCSSAR